MNDTYQDEWFNTEKTDHLLNTFAETAIRHIKYCGITYKFLNYSNSQIKQKSWW